MVHLRARDKATYNCPCENTGFLRYIPTRFRLCPCALLIVIAKASLIGNCLLVRMKGNSISVVVKFILGKKHSFRECVPETILAAITN